MSSRSGQDLSRSAPITGQSSSRHFLAWALERKIEPAHIEPRRPVQNAHVESFDGKLWDECLNASWFGNLNLWEARAKIGVWREKYKEERPHSSLGSKKWTNNSPNV